MKYKIVLNKDQEDDFLIFAREESKTLDKIREILSEEQQELLGFDNERIEKLDISDVFCFYVEEGKVYAMTEKRKYCLKQRLYQLEGLYSDDFIKINQSCLVNKTKIKGFEASIGGALTVILKNGYRDYISRRQLKTVKERMGF